MTRLLTALYACLLRLYPPGFRATFADEMITVFSAALDDAAASGFWPVFRLTLRELATLPASVDQAVKIECQQNTPAYRDYRARFVARYNSLWWGGLIAGLAALRFVQSGELGFLRVVQTLAALCLVLAWRWERSGGLVAMLGGLVLCSLGLWGGYWSGQDAALLTQLLHMTIGLLWGAPFLVFGGLFVRLGIRA